MVPVRETGSLRQPRERVVRLLRHLPGGRHDERLRAFAGAVDALEQNGAESDGLARAALGLDHQVRARAAEGDGCALHGRGRVEPAFAQAANQRVGELQVRERQVLVQGDVLGPHALHAGHGAGRAPPPRRPPSRLRRATKHCRDERR